MADRKSHLNLIPVPSVVYSQLKQAWDIGERTYRKDFFEQDWRFINSIAARSAHLKDAGAWVLEHSDEYDFGLQTGQWRLTDGLTPSGKFTQNTTIILKRWDEGYSANALANVPRKVVHHSPTGHEWGYGGSGARDLALDILCHHLPMKQGVERVDCWAGQCSQEAWDLHNAFCRDFIAPMDRSGGEIQASTVREWIQKNI